MDHTASSTTKVPPNWDATQIPSLKNKIAVVTGANSGIGYVTALKLARHGADVVLACRNESKGEEAAKTIRETLASVDGHGKVDARQLDVSSLKSVQRFSDEFLLQHDKLDILVNNAGVMAIPYEETVDGYEMQFATNHLGHFALTTRLFDALKHSPSARVVNVSSLAHRDAKMNLNAIMTGSKGYDPVTVYSNSKLYNILFTLEFDRRLKSSGITSITSASVHPGISRTNLADAPSTKNSFFYRAGWTLVTWLSWLHVFQGADMGALPSLYAATALEVDGGDFFGPAWSIWGYPALEEPSNESKSEEAATKLWQESERLAKLKFDVK